MPPVASAVGRTAKPNIDPAEWEQRVNLAACYRLIEHFGWTDLIYTHISARVPGEPGHFLLNRFGLLFDEVMASNLIKVDLDGNLVEEPDAPMHKAGFVIHSAIHGGRDDVDCVIHTHSKAGVAVAAMKDGLLPLSQHAQLFYGRVSYHDYEGLAIDIDERARLVKEPRQQPRDDLAQPWAAGGRNKHSARVQQPVQSAVCVRDAGAGDGGQRRSHASRSRRLGAHRQARRRLGRPVRGGMAGPAPQARPHRSFVSHVRALAGLIIS
jgi:hypothetical protein